MSLLRLPVDRPVTTVMIFLAVILMGVIAWTRIPQELFPAMEYPQITIITKYDGAGPEEAEKLIFKGYPINLKNFTNYIINNNRYK